MIDQKRMLAADRINDLLVTAQVEDRLAAVDASVVTEAPTVEKVSTLIARIKGHYVPAVHDDGRL